MAHAGQKLTFRAAGHFRGLFCDHESLFRFLTLEGFALSSSPFPSECSLNLCQRRLGPTRFGRRLISGRGYGPGHGQRVFRVEAVYACLSSTDLSSVFVGMRDERECAGLFGSIAAFLLGLIERLIRCLDQIGGGGISAGDHTGETHTDGGAATVGVRNTERFNSLAKCFRHLRRSVRPGAGKNDHEFVASVPGDEVSWSVDGSRDSGGYLPEAFVPRRMAEGIVIRFETIDVEHDQREWRQFADGAIPGPGSRQIADGW